MKKNIRFTLAAILLFSLIIIENIYAGMNNYGMEGDEVYSYLAATSMGGDRAVCLLEDQTWYPGSYFMDSLTATGAERFNVKMVFENQAMDTHPPLYYLFLNFICSLFTGQFSRWFGIGLNLFFLFFVGAGLFLLLNYFLKNKYLSLVLSAVFCSSYLAVNMTLFIRMYVLLMAFFLFQNWYHLVLFDKAERTVKNYVILGVITFFGAMTHYYFLVYQCMIAVWYLFSFWMKSKKIEWKYILTMGISGITYIIIYPASLNHLIFKYRGREAVHKFLKETSLFRDLIGMFKQFNGQLFHGMFLPLFVLMLFATVILLLCKKIDGRKILHYCFLILPSIIYFWGISKASPFVTIRYISPVAALIFTFMVLWLKAILSVMPSEKAGNIILCIGLFLLAVYVPGQQIKILTFQEKAELCEGFSAECENCVYITGDEYNWKMWEDYVLYPQFDGLYFIDGQKLADIKDEKLLGQKQLVVFIDHALDKEKICDYLKQFLPDLSYEDVYETSYTYILYYSES